MRSQGLLEVVSLPVAVGLSDLQPSSSAVCVCVCVCVCMCVSVLSYLAQTIKCSSLLQSEKFASPEKGSTAKFYRVRYGNMYIHVDLF